MEEKILRSTKISEINRYHYLISLNVELDGRGGFVGEISFGKVAPGITGDSVRYCVKRVTLEINTRDGRFSEVHLLDPANIAAGVNIGRAKEIGSQNETLREEVGEDKVNLSANPSINSSYKDKNSKKDNQNSKVIDTFEFQKFTFSCYGDKKRNVRWDFEPFEDACLRGNLKSLLATVEPEEGKSAFLIDASVSINHEDIEPIIIKKQGKFRRMKEQVIKWYSKNPLDLRLPVSTIQLSVSKEGSDNEVNAA